MTLGLHPKCLARLRESVLKNLAGIRVNNDVFLDFPSLIPLLATEKILPERGEVQEKLNKYIGEPPLFRFIHGTLSTELNETGAYNSERKGVPLNAFPDFGDLQAVADSLIDDFESLPWSYQISFELPHSIGGQIRDALGQFELTENLRIVSPDETYDASYPLQSGIKQRDESLWGGGRSILGLGISQPKQWNQQTAYVQIDIEGFTSPVYPFTTPIEEALSTLKAFMGLSLAVWLLEAREKQVTPWVELPHRSFLIIHRKIDKNWQMWSTYDLPSDLTETFANFTIWDNEGRYDNGQKVGWITNRLPIVSTAFQNPDQAEQVLLAAQWVLDSYRGKNELLSFVQSTVAMEILLGEESKSDVIGIGELLRNRCAYLIGKSRRQRDEILKDFEKIYSIRSKIVHRGKSHLDPTERLLFQKLQWMCRRVISEELELIAADRKIAT